MQSTKFIPSNPPMSAEHVMARLGQSDYVTALDRLQRVQREHMRMRAILEVIAYDARDASSMRALATSAIQGLEP